LNYSSLENKKRLLSNGPPHVQAMFNRVEAYSMALASCVTQIANPKSYIGFYKGSERGTQFLQVKIQKRGLRIVLVPDCRWTDPEGFTRLDGGRQDRAYQNFLVRSEDELHYAFTLIDQAYEMKRG
jgi:predicted transport protein